MRPVALLHVGFAKCASTFLGDQALAAARRGEISALVWGPFDVLINQVAREIGLPVKPFPSAGAARVGRLNVPDHRPLVCSNECLTGHFPPPMRLVSHPVFTAEVLRRIQRRSAELLRSMAADSLSGFDVRVLVITRSPQAWLHSLYRNLVIMGVGETAEALFRIFGPLFAQWLDVDFVVSTYRSLFGDASVFVLPMEMLRERSQEFFEVVNRTAGANVLNANEARNVGLSDGAAEQFRRFWENIDRIVPPEPSWDNCSIRYKQQTWEFLHNAVLNSPPAVDRANTVWGDGTVRYRMPSALIEKMRERMSVLRSIEAFHPYLEEYF